MRLQYKDERGKPRVVTAGQVLILADDGVTPLGLAIDLGSNTVYISHVQEPGFARALEQFGISRVRVIEGEAPEVGQFSFKPR